MALAPSVAQKSAASLAVGSGETVAVACKLPQDLQITHNGRTFNLMGGRLRHPMDQSPLPNPAHTGGYGITPNVPKALFEGWVASMRMPDGSHGFPPLAQGLIFAEPTVERAKARAIEQAELRHGYEQRLAPDPQVVAATQDEAA